MKQEINYSRYVDRYLDGVMNSNEKIWFEKELEGNKELQESVSFHRRIMSAIADTEIVDLQNQLDTIHKQSYKPWTRAKHLSGNPKKILYALGGIAATVVILMFVWVNSVKNNASTADLFAQYYQPAEINMSFRTAEDIVDRDLRSAMVFYETRNYRQAIQLFEKILEGDQSRIGLNLYSGISNMEISEYAKANENFRRIIDHKANAFIESAEWYLGLCYLKTGDVTKAIEIFQAIADSDGYYRKEAKKVLNRIK
jgi:tetratricopeptide (TPR) repeat protein